MTVATRSSSNTPGPVVVTPVRSDAERKEFILFQYEVYAGKYPHFVPPLVMDRENVLNPKKNPWFEFGTMELFLARHRGGPCVVRRGRELGARQRARGGDGAGEPVVEWRVGLLVRGV